MIGKVLLICGLLALAWSASLIRDESDLRRRIVKRHDELVNGPTQPPGPDGAPAPTPNLDDVNPAMILDDTCDNGQENLTMDWDQKPDIYTCNRPNTIPPNNNKPIHYCQDETYEPRHVCTFEHVPPNADYLPVSGAHRPVWPQYGEYKYIPVERYLHGLEHGGIALMYHPCADQGELNKLKQALTGCLWRHIISATNHLDDDYPFAMLAWGCALKLGHADLDLAIAFIKRHALQSSEFAVFFDGFFNDTLIEHSKFVTDKKDKVICPGQPDISPFLLDLI